VVVTVVIIIMPGRRRLWISIPNTCVASSNTSARGRLRARFGSRRHGTFCGRRARAIRCIERFRRWVVGWSVGLFFFSPKDACWRGWRGTVYIGRFRGGQLATYLLERIVSFFFQFLRCAGGWMDMYGENSVDIRNRLHFLSSDGPVPRRSPPSSSREHTGRPTERHC
jgi:hypothetical protein